MESDVVGPPAAPSPNATTTEVEQELVLEDENVLRPLAHRMVEIAELLDHDQSVDPQFIRDGIELWGRYSSELHAERVSHVLALFPATTSAGARSGASERHARAIRRRKAVEAAPSETAQQSFQGMVRDQTLSVERVKSLRSLVELYEHGGYGMRERLASVLRAFMTSEEAWARFEQEFVLKSLGGPLSASVDQRIHAGLTEIARARGHVQDDLQAYLARPIPLVAAAPSNE